MSIYDISIKQGETYKLTITVSDTNLTGYSLRSQARTSYEATDISLDIGSYSSITDAFNGVISVTIPATVTADITKGDYVYDFEIVSGGGEVTRILQGELSVDREVTR